MPKDNKRISVKCQWKTSSKGHGSHTVGCHHWVRSIHVKPIEWMAWSGGSCLSGFLNRTSSTSTAFIELIMQGLFPWPQSAPTYWQGRASQRSVIQRLCTACSDTGWNGFIKFSGTPQTHRIQTYAAVPLVFLWQRFFFPHKISNCCSMSVMFQEKIMLLAMKDKMIKVKYSVNFSGWHLQQIKWILFYFSFWLCINL